MATVVPFRGIRPRSDLAAEVIAPPYDVLSEAEARQIVARQPRSFLRVTRPEVGLPEGSDAHSSAAYALGRVQLDADLAAGAMVQDETPCFYLYVQTWQGRTQSGLMALCQTADYDAGRIKRHELTRPDKEQDRVDHITTLDAQTGLVFLTYRDTDDAVRAAMAEAASRQPDWVATTNDGVTHALIVIDGDLVDTLRAAFSSLDALYVADGHHRSAAASRVAIQRGGAGSSGLFLAGIFPDSEMRILPYNRVVSDLNGHTPEALLAAVGQDFTITPDAPPSPEGRGQWRMYLGGRWYGLVAKPGVTPDDPVGCLDVAVLQDRILAPLLGIENPRTDTRIEFVGGIRGTAALQRGADATGGVAFSLFATGIDQLLAVADADRLMPPKSTWFEPKLRGGVLVHRLIG
jgi:uncharacterized protein (DUF1015 family)